ncbi:MAG: 3-deoxy-D-manno-octulosonic acid transferase [Bacteroidales bacterium]
MAKFLYTTGIYFYWLAIRIASFFNTKARDFICGRKSWLQELTDIISEKNKWIWVHCSSLGEFEQGKPVIDKIKQHHPDHSVLLTFFSPSGYNAQKNYPLVDAVAYMPVDTPRNAKHFVETLDPACALFIKYEFWYHHLFQLKKNKIPVFLISAVFRPSQIFFRWYGKFFRKMLNIYTAVFLQDKYSESLVNSISDTETLVCGDTRFDRVKEVAQMPFQDDILEAFVKDQDKVMVAGSTWPADEKIISECLDSVSGLKVILAPHEIDDKHIANINKLFTNKKICFYTKTTTEEASVSDILVVDVIGILSGIYRYGHFAYIGGGFGKGIHNVLEPVSYFLPVIFGQNYHRFIEAKELIKERVAFPVNDRDMLCRIINKCMNKHFRKQCNKKAQHYMQNKSGTSEKIFDALQQFDVFDA